MSDEMKVMARVSVVPLVAEPRVPDGDVAWCQLELYPLGAVVLYPAAG